MTTPFSSTPAGALRLHYNENTAGCSPAVVAALSALTREDIGRYPDCASINARVGRWLGVDAGWVQVTNGLDEGIQATAMYGAWHYGASRPSPAQIVIVEPAFEVYESCADAVRARIVRVPPLTNFEFPRARTLDAITPQTRVIYLTDPNNPTGIGIPAGDVEAIAAAAPQALVLVDEAYADFSGRTLIGPMLDRYRNIIIGRTFAKGHGIAALRAGAIVAHPATLEPLRKVVLPFSVNIAAITALAAALDDRAYLEWYIGEAAASRDLVYKFCRRRGLTFWPSEANFVLFRVGPDASRITRTLETRGILVRDKSTAPGCGGCIRLTAGVVTDTVRALSALEDILASRTR